MSSRSWSKGPMLDASDPRCECGSALIMSSDGNGMLMERCQEGCYRRPVITRRPTCPECGFGPWGEKTGCEKCGFGVREVKKPNPAQYCNNPVQPEAAKEADAKAKAS